MKDGYVYACINDSGIVKIGMTRNCPFRRVKQISCSAPASRKHLLLAFMRVSDVYGYEKEIHKEFADYWIGGECFSLPVDLLISNLKDYGEKLYVTEHGALMIDSYISKVFSVYQLYSDTSASVVRLGEYLDMFFYFNGVTTPNNGKETEHLYDPTLKLYEPIMVKAIKEIFQDLDDEH